jgi:hypothetical protein
MPSIDNRAVYLVGGVNWPSGKTMAVYMLQRHIQSRHRKDAIADAKRWIDNNPHLDGCWQISGVEGKDDWIHPVFVLV